MILIYIGTLIAMDKLLNVYFNTSRAAIILQH